MTTGPGLVAGEAVQGFVKLGHSGVIAQWAIRVIDHRKLPNRLRGSLIRYGNWRKSKYMKGLPRVY